MPFIYFWDAGSPLSTSPSPDVETDQISMQGNDTRRAILTAIQIGGHASAFPAISGLAFRFKRWTTSASQRLFSFFLNPRDPGAQASKTLIGLVLSQGTGGPAYLGGFVCSAGGPGGWVARDISQGMGLSGASTSSLDLYSSSTLASAPFTYKIEVQE